MKISASKKQLAKIISENGGWRYKANLALFGKESGRCYLLKTDEWPVYNATLKCFIVNASDVVSDFKSKPFANWHQTIITRDEYLHPYPAPDAEGSVYGDSTLIIPGDPLTAMRRMQESFAFDAGPTIEQLTADYRNLKDYADRKQQEADAAKADAAKADAEAKLADLVSAGKEFGLAISICEKEPEMVITDWRDLLVGDVVAITSVFGRDNSGYEHLIDREAVVVAVGNTEFQELVVDRHGVKVHVDGFRFIRRPSKEVNNA